MKRSAIKVGGEYSNDNGTVRRKVYDLMSPMGVGEFISNDGVVVYTSTHGKRGVSGRCTLGGFARWAKAEVIFAKVDGGMSVIFLIKGETVLGETIEWREEPRFRVKHRRVCRGVINQISEDGLVFIESI